MVHSEVGKVTTNLEHVMAKAPLAAASAVLAQALTSCPTEDAHFCNTTTDTQLELALTWSLPELHNTLSESVASQFDSIVLSLNTCARRLPQSRSRQNATDPETNGGSQSARPPTADQHDSSTRMARDGQGAKPRTADWVGVIDCRPGQDNRWPKIFEDTFSSQ